MNNSTRRGFLAAVGLGAAAAGATALAPVAVAGPATAAPPAPAPDVLPSGASGSLTAYVHDVRSGEVAVMVDGHEVLITNRALVATLAQATAGARHGS